MGRAHSQAESRRWVQKTCGRCVDWQFCSVLQWFARAECEIFSKAVSKFECCRGLLEISKTLESKSIWNGNVE